MFKPLRSRDKAQQDLQRSSSLLKSGSATQQIVDQEDAALRSAEAKVAAAAAALATGQAAMGRSAEIEAQKSMVDSLEVADVIAFSGETLAAGAPVVSLTAAAEHFCPVVVERHRQRADRARSRP